MIYSITEGQQAEEYKARKAKEAEDAKRIDVNKVSEREYKYLTHQRIGDKDDKSRGKSPYYPMPSKEDFDRDKKAREITSDFLDKNKGRNPDAFKMSKLDRNTLYGRVKDATNRHMRRHPDQYKESCGIFSNVTFI